MSFAEISYQRHLVIGVETFLNILSFGSYGLRLWVRSISKAKLWWDDYLMGIGLVWEP